MYQQPGYTVTCPQYIYSNGSQIKSSGKPRHILTIEEVNSSQITELTKSTRHRKLTDELTATHEKR